MLILTRRVGEKIMIGEDMSVMVLEVNGRQVRLGIEAPEDVKIVREELILGIQMPPSLKSKPIKKNVKKTTIITKRKKQIADQDLYCFSGLNRQ